MGFHLVRYFTLASLLAFIVVTAGLGYAQRTIAIDAMSSQQEGANVNLAITFANALWGDFKPFVERAGDLSREELQAAPEQAKLRELTLALMRNPSVLKVKVFDLNGLTVFSTEAAQIGDDKSNNAGYLSARDGKVASELTHRDTFSAFEQTIEDRDVLSSYIPLHSPQTGAFEGVFEIYSDVTPFLQKIEEHTLLVIGVVVAALALLYLVLFLIVKRADNIIKAQEKKNSQAQLQVAQSEKMASLGQMVAGVAHELNTPLAFTRSNVSMVSDFVDELKLPLTWGSQLIQRMRDLDQDQASFRVRLTPEIREQIRAFDEDLTPEQIGSMLNDSLDGIDRMSELVVNLKDFTRLDRAKVADFDVNKGIQNVLYIAKSSIPEAIEVATDFGEVPHIRCMPSQINQIVINLVNNAAQALDGEGRIDVRTRPAGDFVEIEVADNGPGIDDETKAHLFEPFYTTKEAGEGTGLGLSIVHDIVREHGGEISVDSTLGEGTSFLVRLPVDQPEVQAEAA